MGWAEDRRETLTPWHLNLYFGGREVIRYINQVNNQNMINISYFPLPGHWPTHSARPLNLLKILPRYSCSPQRIFGVFFFFPHIRSHHPLRHQANKHWNSLSVKGSRSSKKTTLMSWSICETFRCIIFSSFLCLELSVAQEAMGTRPPRARGSALLANWPFMTGPSWAVLFLR